jgi:hypothetical protein
MNRSQLSAPTHRLGFATAFSCSRGLERLGEESLRQVALLKMEGCANDEVAQRLDCSWRTVARKLETIRIIWSDETP